MVAGAERAVEALRLLIPAEDEPIHALAIALGCGRGDGRPQSAADTATPEFGTDENVLEEQAWASEEG